MKIKIIPNVLTKDGRNEFEPKWQSAKTVRDYLRALKIKTRGMRVIMSGKRLRSLSVRPAEYDEIIVTPEVEDPISMALSIGWALTASFTASMSIGTMIAVAYTVGAIVLAGIVGIATLAIISAFQQPRKPSFGSTSGTGGMDSNSPTYGWDGVQTTQNVGTPVGVIYGEHKVGGNIINQFITNDGDKNYLHTLLALGEGEIESISDVMINDNPVSNFDGVETDQVLGTNSQASIKGYEDLHDVNTIAVVLNTQNDAHIYTSAADDVEAFEVLLTFPSGIYSMGGSGSVGSNSVQFKIEYRLYGAGAWTELGIFTLSESNRSAVRRIYRKDGLAAGRYEIKVTRISEASTVSAVSDMTWTHLDEVRDDSLSYPNTALLSIKYLATDQLSGGTPNVTCIVKGRKIFVPAILTEEGGDAVDYDDYYYDSVSQSYKLFADNSELYWDETTYATRFSANPAWIIYDILTNKRFGLGEFIDTTHLDLASFLEMANYCDEKVADGDGGYEKRFRLDCVIDSETKSIDALQQLASTFRAIFFYAENCIKLCIDKPALPVQMFTMGNIISDSFTQKWKSVKEIPNVIQVQYLDRDKNYEQEMISYVDEDALAAGAVLRKKETRLFCTRQTQAMREARYFLNFSKYVDRAISFKAGIDAIACQVGDVIDFAHDVPQWGFSGRVVSAASATQITLDRPVMIEAGKTYSLKIKHSDDTIESKTVTNGAGSTNVITVASAFSFTPSAYDIYSLGETAIVTKPFRIMSLQREPESEVSITAVEYNGTIYDDSVPPLPTPNYSALELSPPDVDSLTLTERLVRLNDGTIENVIDVWFQKPLPSTRVLVYQKAKIYLSDDGGASYAYKGETYGTHFAIQGNLTDGISYKVKVVSVSVDGIETALDSAQVRTIQLIGKSAPPSDVTTFIAVQSRDRLYFGWSAIDDLDLSGYEIRYGESWETGSVIVTNLKNTNLIRLDLRIGNNQSYWIKAIDTSGNYSTHAAEAVISIENIPFTNIIESYSEQTSWTGTKADLVKNGDVLIHAPEELIGTYVSPVRDVGYVASFKVGIETVIDAADVAVEWDDDLNARFDDDNTLRFSGREIVGAGSFRIKTSEDNITWSGWSVWQPGDYKCRYFQLEMTLSRPSTTIPLECSELNYYTDLPDVDEFGDGEVTVAANGDEIAFTKTFHRPPAVNISILNGQGMAHQFISSPTTTGFATKLYKLDGTAVTGGFRYHAHGV